MRKIYTFMVRTSAVQCMFFLTEYTRSNNNNNLTLTTNVASMMRHATCDAQISVKATVAIIDSRTGFKIASGNGCFGIHEYCHDADSVNPK